MGKKESMLMKEEGSPMIGTQVRSEALNASFAPHSVCLVLGTQAASNKRVLISSQKVFKPTMVHSFSIRLDLYRDFS